MLLCLHAYEGKVGWQGERTALESEELKDKSGKQFQGQQTNCTKQEDEPLQLFMLRC